MPGILKRRSTPPILALSAVVLLGFVFVLLNGSGSQGAGVSGLAGYMPPDSVAYAETDLMPDGKVGAEVDQVVRRLTGSSLSASLDRALGRSKKSGIDYREDVEPWLSGPVAVSTGSSEAEIGLVAEVEDVEAARSFAAQMGDRRDLPAGSRAEVLGDALIVSGSQAWLDRIKEAFAGESLADNAVFNDSMEDLPEGGLASLFVSNGALLRSIESEDFATSPILETLGLDPDGTGTAMTLVVDGNSISMTGSSGLSAEGETSGAADLIESFPAGSLLAAGSGDVGESLSALIKAIDQTGATLDEADPEEAGPGDISGLFGQASAFGIDLPDLIASLESAGVFVTAGSGGSGDSPGGALVATTSDPDLVSDSISSISTLGAFAGGDFFKPLPDDLEGFSIALPGMTAGRITVAAEADRLVFASGIRPARQALSPGDRTLGDTDLYRLATSELGTEALSLFATPSRAAPLIRKKTADYGMTAGRKDGPERMARLISSIETVAAGSGENGSFEVEIDLKD